MENWHFREKAPGEKERNPVTAEYFDDEAIGRPAQALVREVIQNSLDARAGGDAVKVRFYVSGPSVTLAAERAACWLGGAWDHLTAPDSGLRNVTERPGPCPFLVVEDFSTKGLEGNPEASDLEPAEEKNHFYAFFRAEGVSENTGGRGKWGVGKTVFPRSSRINALFGFTVRGSDRRGLLMGQTILRYHRANGRKYAPDGTFGIAPDSDDFVLPISDPVVLQQFCRDFRIQRREEPGLSVAVPYYHDEITADAIVKAVAREYFFSILTGKLTVIVEGPELGVPGRTLDSNNLLDSIESDDTDIDGDLQTLIDLAAWAHTHPPAQRDRLDSAPSGEPPEWSQQMFPTECLTELASRFARGERLALRVPLSVRRTDRGDAQDSYFDVFLQQDLNGRGYPPEFIRNGIRIPQTERRLRGHNLLALVIIDDQPLAAMLGDAETPAHAQWSHQTQNFLREEYQHGKACLDFVRTAPRRIVEILSASRQQRDRLALADFFPRPPENDGLEATQEIERRKPGEGPERSTAIDLGREVQPFTIERTPGGFRIRRTGRDVPCPPRIEVRVAYDRTRGNPLLRYRSADFRLESMPKRLPGAREVHCRDNRMTVDILEDEFRIEVSGFDVNRDLYVRVRPMEREE